MSATYRATTPITSQRDIFLQPVTALAFDPVSDALWTGGNSGDVVAYYTSRGMRGVVFPVGGDSQVKKITATDSNVRAFGSGSSGIGAWGKGGVNKWYCRMNAQVTAFSDNAGPTSMFAAATDSPELLLVNSQTGDIMRRSPVSEILTHLVWTSSHLISGSSEGWLRLHDSRDVMRLQPPGGANIARAHVNSITGLQASGNYIYTIGLGTRQGRPFPDPLVKVYDVRTMRPLTSLPFASSPAFIDLVPKRQSTIAITSNEGFVNIADASNPNSNEFYQLDTTSYITSVAVSPTGTYMAFGDSAGVIHLMTAADEGTVLPLNGFEGKPIEWVDAPEQLPDIEWNDSTPLSSIGLPYYKERLLSSWTADFLPDNLHYPPPMKIPQQVLSTMKINGSIAYTALPKELRGRRNVVASGPKKTEGRFRSGKTRRNSEPDTPTFDYNPDAIPRMYRKVEIEYSKFGVEDFDFGFYNKTEFSGLETHIINSYTNALLQVMHYTLPIRRLAKSHITTDCPLEHCLLCELGFVTRMLEDAYGTNCQSSNFCKAVNVLAQMQNAIEVIDYGRESAELNYSHKIQAFHRFLVDHLSAEGNSFPYNPRLLPNMSARVGESPAPAPVTQLLGLDAKNIIVCTHCKAVRSKENMTHVIDMMYPRKRTEDMDFTSILQYSLLRQTTHKATCQTCKHFATFESRRSIRSQDLPPILAINAAVFSEETHKFWKDGRNSTFLKPTVEVHGQIEGADDPDPVLYELRAMVVQIVQKDQHSHLVAIVKIPENESEFPRMPHRHTDTPWFIFNDFVVRNISEEEALSFPATWKVPSVIYLERVDSQNTLDLSELPDKIDDSILCRDTNIALNRDMETMKHELLSYDELPTPGTLIAIDAEFVSMQQEETEYRSDGTKKVLRPARLSLARVSVLRGDGSKEGVPFIDDHIHTSEDIVDYLTEFSGIKFGDLDPHLTRHTLTPLKVVYKKLRLLVDRGCVFVGHGLSKDFRIINIFVPPEQIIDTVDLYFLQNRQRRLSLRFLVWFVLGDSIQTDTHDSIEDALSALRLYKAYHKFESDGVFDNKLDEIYREGRQYNFKPPQAPGTSPPPIAAPPAPRFVMPSNVMMPMAQFPGAGFPPQPFAATPSPNPFMQPWRTR